MTFMFVGQATILSRAEWGARGTALPPDPLKVRPAPYAIIHHTASQPCFNIPECVLSVRNIQSYHIDSNGWNDIGYNFLVGGDGVIYEGRGWGIQGAHTYGYNAKSIGIALIGNFQNAQPTAAQLQATQYLLTLGLQANRLSRNYKLIGHRQVAATTSPGNKLYEVIKTWDHWVAKP